MYKVIIAEDELFVRLGVKMSIDWEKLGMEVAADVENGQQALEAWEMYGADIVVTDIKMPVMDGITLIKEIRRRDERTRFIILSCLEEFQIVREAISLGVSDYVLKLTMSQEDMEQVLLKVKRELEITNRTETPEDNGTAKWKFEDALRDQLYYRLDMKGEYREALEEKFFSDGGYIRMVILEIDHYLESRKLFSDAYGSLLEATEENILSELLEGTNHILMMEKDGRSVLLLGDPTGEAELPEDLSGLLEKIREVFLRYLRSTVSFGISGCIGSCRELHENFHDCGLALEKKFFYGTNRNRNFRGTEAEECRELIQRKIRRFCRDGIASEEAVKRLTEEKEGFCQHQNPATIRHYFEYAINVELSRILPDGSRRYQAAEEFAGRIARSQTLDEVLEVYREALEFLKDRTESGAGSSLSRQVKDILLFIQEHYAEDISLDQIAQTVDLSRTYVSGLFKKETGINLTNYITNFRIEKAKELLRDTNLRSYEIAVQVGFPEESYFSRTFKKVTGESPNAYRKGLHRV